jgi:hypothetical protein
MMARRVSKNKGGVIPSQQKRNKREWRVRGMLQAMVARMLQRIVLLQNRMKLRKRQLVVLVVLLVAAPVNMRVLLAEQEEWRVKCQSQWIMWI